jgi:hypothetical protein
MLCQNQGEIADVMAEPKIWLTYIVVLFRFTYYLIDITINFLW